MTNCQSEWIVGRRYHYLLTGCVLTCWTLMTLASGLLTAQEKSKQQTGVYSIAESSIPEVRRINEEVRQVWKEYEITPSMAATDGEWCRRLHLDIIGRIPTVDELNAFLADKDNFSFHHSPPCLRVYGRLFPHRRSRSFRKRGSRRTF